MSMALLQSVTLRGREISKQSEGADVSGRAFYRWKRLQHVLCECHKRSVQALTSRPCERDLIWKQGLCRCDGVKARSSGIRVGPNPVTGVLIKRDIWREAQTTARQPRDDGGRDWRDASRRPGVPRMASQHQSGRGGRGQILPQGLQRGLSSANTPTEVCCLRPLSWGLPWQP